LDSEYSILAVVHAPIVRRLKIQSHNCWSNNCSNDSEIMQAAVNAWGELRGQDGNSELTGSVKVYSAELTVPENLSETFQRAYFDMASVYSFAGATPDDPMPLLSLETIISLKSKLA